ncbi:hypothetical protein B4U80_05423 [Leptotrombidium deliense]|uniref:Uncharacterized protein n=1 Tax=Leptotrombidium deliense TaxID=299467 RepID=A0A443S214_9ACAR|nr:hypothetical protein B4U80_05423 [Leptotrombidium deliense]
MTVLGVNTNQDLLFVSATAHIVTRCNHFR